MENMDISDNTISHVTSNDKILSKIPLVIQPKKYTSNLSFLIKLTKNIICINDNNILKNKETIVFSMGFYKTETSYRPDFPLYICPRSF